MPTYEYECRDCGNEFEVFQQMSDKCLKKCPQCGGRLKRLKAKVDMEKCTGCGICAGVCPAKAYQVNYFRDDQILAMVDSSTANHL